LEFTVAKADDEGTSDVAKALPIVHNGVEYILTAMAPGLWKWQCQIGDRIKTGRVKANLRLLAERRIQMAINRELRVVFHAERSL
jgi:hypothetical protein